MPSKAQKRKRNAARKHGTAAAKMRDGGTTLLQDKDHPKADTALILKAVEKRFPITQTIAKKLVRRLTEVIEKKTVQIASKDGVFDCEATADKNAIAAGNALRAMAAMNQRDEIEAIRRTDPQKQTPQTTINVGVNVDNRIDERRSATLAIAERVRAGRILQQSDGG